MTPRTERWAAPEPGRIPLGDGLALAPGEGLT
jgi:hypothetical protein